MERYLGVLRQLKDFDENMTREIAAKAYVEQEKMKVEVSINRKRKTNGWHGYSHFFQNAF